MANVDTEATIRATANPWILIYNSISEIKLYAELQEARLKNRRRPSPHREVEVLRDHGIRVHDVVEIDVQRGARPTKPDDLRRAKIELIVPIAVHRSGLNQVDRHVSGAARQWPPERLRGHRRRQDVIGCQLRAGNALECSADLNPASRKRVH